MLKPIKTEDQYNEALARVYELMQIEVKEDTTESDELEILSILVKEYEIDHYPIPTSNPLGPLNFGLTKWGCPKRNWAKSLAIVHVNLRSFRANGN
jgi:HTH-type transcriptional regulator/antitoxin HigA